MAMVRNKIASQLYNRPFANNTIERFIYGAFIAVASYIIWAKPFGPSRDEINYVRFYERYSDEQLATVALNPDGFFFALGNIHSKFGISFEGFSLTIAILTVTATTIALRRTLKNSLYFLPVYGSYLFWLHPYTQIRSALGISLLLVGLYGFKQRAWIPIALAVYCHNGILIAVAIILVIERQYRAFLLVLIALFVLYQFEDIGAMMKLSTQRISSYEDLTAIGVFTGINLFSLMPISMALFLAVTRFSDESMTGVGRSEWLLSLMSLIAFYGLSFTPVVAFRVSEMLMIFFTVFAARACSKNPILFLALVPYCLIGLRSVFFAENALL